MYCEYGTTGIFEKIGGSAIKVYLVPFVCVATASMFVSIASHIGDPALAGAISSLPTNVFDQVNTGKKLIDVIVEIVPGNIISPFLDGPVLLVLFLGILFGIVLAALKDKVPTFIKLFEEINKIFLKIVEVVIWFLPFVIISNVSKLIIGIPVESFYSVLECVFEMLIVTATMPNGIASCRDCGIDSKIYSITMPLGTSLNKNGSAISEIVTTIFMCYIFQVDISPSLIATLLVMDLVFNVAAPAVNGGGIICMAAIFSQLGIPSVAICLYIVINQIVDLIVTGTNVLGNVFASLLVAVKHKMFDKD